MSVPVHVLRLLARPARIGTDRRIEHGDGDGWVGKVPARKIPARKIQDAYAVALANRAKRSLPDADPARMRDQPELRALGPQPPVLLFDGKRQHGGSVTPWT
ncbi:MAG: hypothetical protein ACRD9W_14220, partial [Terriglobia bacterium]